MAVDQIFGDTADDDIYSSSATYATARAGSGSKSTQFSGATVLQPGQCLISTTYYCLEAFIGFDTSIVGTDTVSSAVLSLYGNTDQSATDFICEARVYDWGATVTTADYVAGASINQTIVATFNTTGFTGSAYNNFTDVAMAANINGSGVTRLMLDSDRMVAGTVPTGREEVQWINASNTGTTLDPYLTVTHAPAAAAALPPGTIIVPRMAIHRAATW